jgi:hydrogenase 3 maturation protease
MVISLRKTLKETLRSSIAVGGKLAVLGIGSELRGDDGAGILIVEKLQKSLSRLKKRPAVKIFIGGTAPENLTGEIKRYKPSHIIIVDTADFKEKPGTVVVLDPRDVGSGVSFSTHKMPAKILVDYLQKSFPCEVTIIGIQPKTVDFGKPLSKAVADRAKEVAAAIGDIIRRK